MRNGIVVENIECEFSMLFSMCQMRYLKHVCVALGFSQTHEHMSGILISESWRNNLEVLN